MNWAAPRSRGDTVDELRLLLRAGSSNDGLDGLCDLASCLRWDGSVLTLGDARDESWWSQVEWTRWIGLFLPRDLLAAASSSNLPPSAWRLDPSPPQIRRMLRERQLVDLHIHVGASVDPTLLWSWLATQVGRISPQSMIRDLGDGLRLDGSHPPAMELTRRVFAAHFARLALAEALLDPTSSPAALVSRWGGGRASQAVALRGIDSLLGGVTPPDSAQTLAAAWRRIVRAPPTRPLRTAGDVFAADPVAKMLPPGRAHGPMPEIALLRGCFRTFAPGSTWSTLAHQVVRIRCQLHRALVQAPGVRGLQWFSVHKRALQTVRPSGPVLVDLALDRPLLDAIELRTVPPTRSRDLERTVTILARSALAIPPDRRPEVGWVLHLLRRPGRPTSVPFRAWASDALRRVSAVDVLLQRKPHYVRLVRGFDLAGQETQVPWWVARSYLRRMRQVGRRAAHALSLAEPGAWVEAPRLTVHAAEDAHHRLEGLRRFDEVARDLVPGERIGHGLYLGDVRQRQGVRHQPLIERLLDLGWELDTYRSGRVEPRPGRVERLRGHVERLMPDRTADDVLHLWRDLRDERVLAWVGLIPRAWTRDRTREPRELALEYLTTGKCW
ncbi:MAG: hypothetical protein KC621_05695 [Myxococcales bacterium]|nr:hypothetical protein [Myxococcales bacterium]